MGFQVTVAGTGDENKDQSGQPLGGIEQNPERTHRLPPFVQDSISLAVLASLPLILAIPNLDSFYSSQIVSQTPVIAIQ
jgi:hypothetical protein